MPRKNDTPEAKKERYEKKKVLDQQKKASADRLAEIVNRRGALRPKVPHLVELLEDIMKEMKGTQALAKFIVEDLKKAKPGSQQRTKYLGMIAGMIEVATRLGMVGEPLDPSSMSDDDLRAECANLMGIDDSGVPSEEDTEGDSDE